MGFAHHGNAENNQKLDAEMQSLMERFQSQVDGRAKRFYSQGRINPEDDGDLAAAITTDFEKRRVIMDFGKGVTWLAMTEDDARRWGQELLRRANELKIASVTASQPPSPPPSAPQLSPQGANNAAKP